MRDDVNLTYERLGRLLEDAGEDVLTDYSGRNMYGQQCLAVVCSSPLNTLAGIVECCDDVETAADVLRGCRQDGMGSDTVLYWPNVLTKEQEAERQKRRAARLEALAAMTKDEP